jgi:thiol-disulfide isomerase/thioredoxin
MMNRLGKIMRALVKGPDDSSREDTCVLVRSGEELEAVLRSKERLFVLFYASWCPFSQAFLKIYQEHAASGEPCYMRILVDDGDALATKYAIDVFPTVLYFENGRVTKRLDGEYHRGLSKGQLEDFNRRCAVPGDR